MTSETSFVVLDGSFAEARVTVGNFVYVEQRGEALVLDYEQARALAEGLLLRLPPHDPKVRELYR